MAKRAQLRDKYMSEVVPKLREEFKYSNIMEVPGLEKVVISIGLGEAVQNSKVVDHAVGDLAMIAGQKPVITKARRSIATYKLREGMNIGTMVTLRSRNMWEFLTRLLNVAVPRVRDFKGLSPKAFDGRGNYSMGVKEQIIFPEIDYDKIDKIRGMNITIVTSAKTDEEARALLRHLGMPFRK